MTQAEKDLKIADLIAQIRAVEATEVTVHKVWEPGEREIYFYSSHLTSTVNYVTCSIDLQMIPAGLAHPTKEAAERHHSFLVMLHDLHKFAVEHNEGWKPDFMTVHSYKYSIGLDYGKVIVSTWTDGFNGILPYFKSFAIAQKAIDTFGDRLKILFEYYNS